MASNIKFKRSAVQNRVPTTAQLELGELALNTYDGKLYTEINTGSASVVEIGSKLSSLVVDGDNGGGNGDVVFHGATAGRDLTWDASINRLHIADNADLAFGDGNDLIINHTGNHSFIQDAGQGHLILLSNSLYLQNTSGTETYFKAINNNQVDLYHNNAIRVTTTVDGADISGTGSLKLPVGTTAQRSGSPTAGDMRYNSTTGSFEGYTNGWGELGGAGIGIGSTSVNPGSGVVGHIVGVGYTTINFVGAGLSVTGYGSTVVVDIGNAVSRKYGRKIHSYTATNNQTTFTGLSYTDGASQVSVYLNGAKLSAATYTATSGNTVVLGTGASVDDEVEILVLDSGVDITRTVHSFTATAGQTAFTGLGYERGENLDVYLNGIRLAQSDYTATNGTSITLAVGASVGDILEIVDMGPGAQWESGFGEDNDDIFRFNGGVGIGTTNPTDKLNIVGNAEILGILTATTFKGDGSQLTGVTQTTINSNADNRIITGSGTANTLNGESTLTYGGTELLISNASPSVKLNDTDNSGVVDINNVGGAAVFQSTGDTLFETNSTERLRINSSGQVSLGNNPTVASDAGLHIELTGAREYLRLNADAGNTNAYIEIQADDNRRKALIFKSGGTRRGVIGVGDSDEATNATSLFFSASSNIAGNSPHMVITSAGKVGVAQASPDYALDVTGDIGFTAQMRGASGSASAPAYSFDGDSDSGMFRSGVNTLSFATSGTARVTVTDATTTVANNLTVTGNLQVDGTNTVVNSTTMTVDDKNIVLGSGAANDAAADGGGITLESGNGNKTWNWVDATDAWTSSEHIHLGDDKQLLLGTSSDFKIYHSNALGNVIAAPQGHTTKFYGPQVEMYSLDGTKKSFVSDSDASVELYENNVKKFETTGTGVNITGVTVDDGATHDGDVIFYGASYNMVWDKSDNALRVNDSARIKFGTHKDLHIYHNGSNSVIREEGTGNLNLQTTGGNVDILVNTTEHAAKFISNGAVELYHDNSKKFETQANGITVTGGVYSDGLICGDNDKVELGTGADLTIWHNGSHSFLDKISGATGNLYIRSFDSGSVMIESGNGSTGSENAIVCNGNSSVDLYHSGTWRLKTTSSGVETNGEVTCGNVNASGEFNMTGNGEKYLDFFTLANSNTVTFRHHNPSGNGFETFATFTANGAATLSYDGNTKFATRSDGVKITGEIYLDDNSDIKIGTSQDINIWHNGTSSGFDNKTGHLYIRGNSAGDVGGNIYIQALLGENSINCINDGAVELYHNGSLRLYTSNAGSVCKRQSGGATEFDVIGCEGNDGTIRLLSDDGDDNADYWRMVAAHVGNEFSLQSYAGGSWQKVLRATDSRSIELMYQGSKKIQTTSDGFYSYGNINAYGSDGGNSNGQLNIRCTGSAVYSFINFYNSAGNANTQILTHGGNTIFYDAAHHNHVVSGTETIELTSTGWHPRTSSINIDLGTSSKPWRTLYADSIDIEGHDIIRHNDHNLIIRNATNAGSSGICGESSNGTFQYQIYGNGGAYGFLDGKWANWDIQKTVGGELAVDVGGTLYTVYHTGNSSSLSGGVHANAMSKMTSSGTWNKPSGCTMIKVTVTAGGGGGGSHNADDAHGGGGAGGTSIKWIDVTSISSVSVTVGSGGGGGAGNQQSSGNGGGASSFGSHCSASGGGHPTAWGRGGGGGGASGGDLNLQGGGGGSGNIDGQGNEEAGGTGGGSYWGGGQSGGTAWGQRHSGGTYGTGGAGSHAGTDNDGADGNGGIVVIEHFY